MSRVKERVIGETYKPLEGIGKLVKAFFGNGETNIKEDDLDREVNAIMAEQDSNLISKYEKSVASSGNKAGGKKSDRIKVKTTNNEITSRQVEDRERDEER